MCQSYSHRDCLYESGGIGPLPDGLTNYCPSVLDTVGWVIRPIEIVPDIMTYNVFGGTLNPTLLYLPGCLAVRSSVRHKLVLCRNGSTYRQTVFTA